MMIATIVSHGEGGGRMWRMRYRRSWGRSRSKRLWGIPVAAMGAFIIFKVLPLWIWPFGIGLWLLWAGLGPLVMGGALIWIGWRLLSA